MRGEETRPAELVATALEAALTRIAALGIEEIYCGGDLVGYGSRPNEVALVEERTIPTIYGNYDYSIVSVAHVHSPLTGWRALLNNGRAGPKAPIRGGGNTMSEIGWAAR